MADEHSVICHIVELVDKSLSTNISNANRSEIYNQLNSYANGCRMVDGLKLLESGYPELAKNLGFQILLNIVQTKWNNLTPTDKFELQNKIFDIFQNCAELGIAESNLLQNAFSKLFVAVLLRSWPKYWPNALNGLNNRLSVSSHHAKLALLCDFMLVEDLILDYNPVPPTNKQNSIALFQKQLPNLWNQWCNLLKEYMGKLIEIDNDIYPGEAKNVISITSICLQLFSALCEGFANLDLVLKDEFLLTVFNLLKSCHTRTDAAICIEEILQRKRNKENYERLKIFFDEKLLNYFVNCVDEAALEDPEFIERVASILTALGNVLTAFEQGPVFWSRVKPVLPTYFKILLNICNSFPGIRMQRQGFDMWVRILSVGDEIWAVEGIEELSTDLLCICKNAITSAVKFQYKELAISDNEFDTKDFQDEQDYIGGLGRLKNDAMRTLCEIAKRRHAFVMHDMCEEIEQLIADTNGANNEVKWGVLSSYVTSVFRGLSSLPDMNLYDQDTTSTAKKLSLVTTNNVNVLEGVYTAFTCFVPALVKMNEMDTIKHTLLNMIQFLHQGVESQERNIKSSRRGISRLVVDICSHCYQYLKPEFDVFFTILMKLVSNRSESSAIRAAASESLIVLISGLGDADLEKEKLEIVGASLLVPELNVTNVNDWIQYTGLHTFDPEDTFKFAGNRGQILVAVKVLYCTLKTYKGRVESTPFVHQFLLQSLDWVFTQVGLLNMLFIDEHTRKIHSTFRNSLGLGEQERNQILEKKFHPVAFEESHYVQVFIDELFVSLYQVIGICCKELGGQFTGSEQLPHLFRERITQFLPIIHHTKTARFLAYTMKAIVELGCQSEPSPTCISLSVAMLSELQKYLVPKLAEDWTRINNFRCTIGLDVADLHVLQTGSEEQKEEIIFENVTRSSTAEYLKLLEKIVMTKVNISRANGEVVPGKTSSESSPSVKGNNQLAVALVSRANYELYHSIVTTLCVGMQWSDSSIANRCCDIIVHFILLSMQHGDKDHTAFYDTYLHMFQAALAALAINGYMELVYTKSVNIIQITLSEPCMAYSQLRETCLQTLMELKVCQQSKKDDVKQLILSLWACDTLSKQKEVRKKLNTILQKYVEPMLPTNVSQIFKKNTEFPILNKLSVIPPNVPKYVVTDHIDHISLGRLFSQ